MRGIYYDPSVVLPRSFSLFKTNRPLPSLAVGIQNEKKAGEGVCVIKLLVMNLLSLSLLENSNLSRHHSPASPAPRRSVCGGDLPPNPNLMQRKAAWQCRSQLSGANFKGEFRRSLCIHTLCVDYGSPIQLDQEWKPFVS